MDINTGIRDQAKLLVSKNMPEFGIPIIDMMITTMIFMFLGTWINKLIDFFDDVKGRLNNGIGYLLRNIWTKHYQVSLIATKTTISKSFGRELDYSDKFIAINEYILDNVLDLKDLYSLKEEMMKKSSDSWQEVYRLVVDNENFIKMSDDFDVKYTISKNDSEDEKAKKTTQTTTITIRSKTKNLAEINEFIDNITESYLKELSKKTLENQYYFEYESTDEDHYNQWSETVFSSKKSFNSVFFENKNEFIEKYRFFLNNKDWYDEREIPWHFGLLLHGKPGCGKTSIIKALTKENKDHILSIPLSRVKKAKDLTSIFHSEKILRHKIPFENRIYVFEDIDAMNFSHIRTDNDDIVSVDSNEPEPKEKKEENTIAKLIKSESQKLVSGLKSDDDPITLSHFLNLIDGLLEIPGRRIVFTTNHREKLDPALIRKGRIDIEIETKLASKEIINEMYKWFYKTSDDIPSDKLEQISDYKITPAEVNNIFYQFSLEPEKAVNLLISK